MILPAFTRPHFHGGFGCYQNLHQIGLAFNTWALDNGNRFPMQVSTDEGGTRELSIASNAFLNFRVMSNELSTPKVLVCPGDTRRHWATNFTSDLNNSRLSYFVGLDSVPTNVTMLLSGDHNLTNSSRAANGILTLRPGDTAGWTHEIHKARGNILLADGSVQLVSNQTLRAVLQGAFTNRLAMP
jgi:prepilin-type processing-associated H-X9-DG protein